MTDPRDARSMPSEPTPDLGSDAPVGPAPEPETSEPDDELAPEVERDAEFAPEVEREPGAAPEPGPEPGTGATEPARESDAEVEPEPALAAVIATGAQATESPEHGRGGMALPVISRRTFLAAGAAVACGAAGAFAIGQVFPLPAGVDDSPVVVRQPAWTFVADTTKCIGCGLCVAACKAENNVTEIPEFARTWIERHLVAADGTVYVDSPEGGINGFPRESEAPGAADASIVDAFFEPRLCMQCANSPCTAVCPVGATYRTPDGVVLVDPRRCIGCGYCVVSCPYGARYLAPSDDRSPTGIVGVADKCTWCYHRITAGRVPACVEVCPVGARAFGDLSDPTSPIHDVLKGKKTHTLHPEFGTKPVVLYVGSTRDGKEPS